MVSSHHMATALIHTPTNNQILFLRAVVNGYGDCAQSPASGSLSRGHSYCPYPDSAAVLCLCDQTSSLLNLLAWVE